MDIVIIGSSAASKSAISTLLNINKNINITVITKDEKYFYSKVLLPNYIAGEIDEKRLYFVDNKFFQDERLDIVQGKVIKIEPEKNRVLAENLGYRYYDKLIIATGSTPVFSLGQDLEGVSCLRHVEDAKRIKKLAKDGNKSIVLGGGLVSLKAAWALNKINIDVSVLVGSNRLLSRTMDDYCSQIIEELFIENGVKINFGTDVQRMISEEGKLTGVITADNKKIPCDMAIIGKGVKPEMDLAVDCGLKTDKGIIVDNTMATSIENIYAAGDVAQSYSLLDDRCDLFTLWPAAIEQGKVAAMNILGIKKEYQGGISMNSVKFYGIPFITIGDISGNRPNCTVYINKEKKKKIYRKIIMEENRIIGGIFAGDINYAGMVYWDIKSKREIQSPEKYLTGEGLKELHFIRNK